MADDPDEIRGHIEQTQQELSGNVDALTDKISPQQMMKRRAGRARSAMTNVKDKIMGTAASGTSSAGDTVSSAAATGRDKMTSAASSAGDTVTSAADAVQSAPETARQRTEGNPLAAGVIAFGAGWIISSLLPASTPERQLAAQAKDTAVEKGRPVAEQLGEAAQEMKEHLRVPAQQSAESVKTTAADAASTVGDQAQSAASGVAGQAKEAKDAVAGRTRKSQ